MTASAVAFHSLTATTMWCTRWFLPLLILPLPTASPFFLTMYLISVSLHARPCFYCMILLTALFSSTCYWQPISTNTLLTKSIGNASTFGDAITANLSMYDEESRIKYAPAVVQLLDRCWCDFGFGLWSMGNEGGVMRGDLFSPRDVVKWENASIQMARGEYVRKLKADQGKEEGSSARNDETEAVDEERDEEDGLIETDEFRTVNGTRSSEDSPFLWRLWDGVFQSTPSSLNRTSEDDEQAPTESQNDTAEAPAPSDAPSNEPWLRREYDLRKHGLDIVIDFGWSRKGS